MVEKDVVLLLQDALEKNDLLGVRQAYATGLRNVKEMPKVHDLFAVFMSERGFHDEAMAAIGLAISQNRQRLERCRNPKSLFDLGLSNFNALSVAEEMRFTDKKLSIYVANAFHFFWQSEQSWNPSVQPSDDDDDVWWGVDAPFHTQQYWLAELLMKRSFPSLFVLLNWSPPAFDRFSEAHLLFARSRWFIGPIVRTKNPAPPELKEVLEQVLTRCKAILASIADQMKVIEERPGFNKETIISRGSGGSRLASIALQLEKVSSSHPYFEGL
jgi:hypothetical protein